MRSDMEQEDVVLIGMKTDARLTMAGLLLDQSNQSGGAPPLRLQAEKTKG